MLLLVPELSASRSVVVLFEPKMVIRGVVLKQLTSLNLDSSNMFEKDDYCFFMYTKPGIIF